MGRFARGREPGEIAEQIAALGDMSGRPVMVHASLRRLGPVRGGARGVIDAVRTALDPDGTMVMMIAADDGEPFDPATTPADPENGVLAEVFRSYPDVQVNDNPACRFAARLRRRGPRRPGPGRRHHRRALRCAPIRGLRGRVDRVPPDDASPLSWHVGV